MKFQARCVGTSRDGRTNRWRLICECGKSWEPTTTRLARRDEECPKCNHSEEVDYNKWIDLELEQERIRNKG